MKKIFTKEEFEGANKHENCSVNLIREMLILKMIPNLFTELVDTFIMIQFWKKIKLLLKMFIFIDLILFKKIVI